MSTFVLIPGAGGAAWYWSRVVPILEKAGHQAIAVELPGDDKTAGLAEYAEIVQASIGSPRPSELVIVGQSLGGFTAAIVAARLPVASLIFVNAMIPNPGELAGDWGSNTGANAAREAGGYGEFDLETYFLHDVPVEVAAEGESHQRAEADVVFSSICEFEAWPAVPIYVLAGADDRFFPATFQQDVARDRLGVEADVLPGGHLMALSQPGLVAGYLLQHRGHPD